MRILAMGAHPDDIEYGCGGTLLLASSMGHEVSLMIMTEGLGHADRRREQEHAARFLGAKNLIWGGFKDTELAACRETITAIEKAIETVFDFTPHGIIETLQLKRPIYQKTAAYGHFGRDSFTWEKTDKVEALKSAIH